MFSLPWENWLRLGIWFLFGLVIYFGTATAVAR